MHWKWWQFVFSCSKVMGTLTSLTCEWNVTWTGPRIHTNSFSALILFFVNFVDGWLLYFEYFADKNFTGEVVRWGCPSLDEFFGRRFKYTTELLSSHLSRFNAEVNNNWSRVFTVHLISERRILYAADPLIAIRQITGTNSSFSFSKLFLIILAPFSASNASIFFSFDSF